MVNLQTGEGGSGLVLGLDLICYLTLEFGRLVLVVRILENAVFEKCVVKVVGVSFTEERSVEVEDGNAVDLRNEIGARFVGDRFDIRFQRLRRLGGISPQ